MSTHTIWLGPTYRAERAIYFSFSSPVPFCILRVVVDPSGSELNGIRSPSQQIIPETQGISIFGGNDFKPIVPELKFLPGDYSIGIGLPDPKLVQGLYVQLSAIEISQLQIYQLLSALTRSFGHEPSHILNQPARSTTQGTPLHRKIRSDLEAARKEISTQISDLRDTLVKSNEKSVEPVVDLTKIQNSYNQIYLKLQEAENYIEELESQITR